MGTSRLKHRLITLSTFIRVPVDSVRNLRLVVMTSSLCGGMKIDQFTRTAHPSDKFIYSFKQNIKYTCSYFIGLCRYKILNIVILLVFVDTNHVAP